MPTGSLTLKAYYIAFRDDPFTPPGAKNSHVPYQIAFGDDNFSPLRPLVCQLHHSLGKPFELFLDYTRSLETASRPRMEILAMDCIDSQTNRLKVCILGFFLSFAVDVDVILKLNDIRSTDIRSQQGSGVVA